MSKWRKDIDNTPDLAIWYNACFERMGGVWYTSPEEWDAHLSRMKPEAGVSVLDIGCGDGSFLLHAAEIRGINGMGVDLSSWAIDKAKDRRDEGKQGIYFVTGDAAMFMMRVAAGSFDWVVSLGSLEHMLDVEAVLMEAHRLLRTRGQWYFYVPNEKWLHEDQPTELTMTEAEWEALFAKHGLVTNERWTFGDCSAFRGVRV